jgi:flagellin
VQSTAGGLSFGTATSIKVTHGSATSTVTIGSSDTLQDVLDHLNNALNDDGLITVNSNTGYLQIRNNTNTGLSFSVSGASHSKTLADLFGSASLNTVAQGTGPDYTAYLKSFNEILTQIDGLAQDSSFNGKNLLNGDNITITFNEKSSNQNQLQIQGVDDSSTGLGLTTLATNSSTTASSLHAALTSLADALTTIRSQSSKLSANLSIVQTRQDFTKNLVSTLQTGADNLTLADSNEEGASLLALNTRAQLATTALSFSSQADQQVLQFLK